MAITTAVDAVYEVERHLVKAGFTPGGGKAGPAKYGDGTVPGFYVELEAHADGEAYEVIGMVDRNGLRADLAITRRADIDAFEGLKAIDKVTAIRLDTTRPEPGRFSDMDRNGYPLDGGA